MTLGRLVLYRNEYYGYLLGEVKAAGAEGCNIYHLHVPIV
jgi:hypothetical protein